MKADENTAELRLPAAVIERAFAGALTSSIEQSGVVGMIQEQLAAALALRGLMDKAACAKFLGQEERTIEVWMRPAGQNGGRGLPHIKIGPNCVRFRLAAIEQWLEEYEVNRVLPKVA